MKILVIGYGLIATAIIDKLESEGHELLIFSRTRHQGKFHNQVVGDIFNFEEFKTALLWNPQVIIHTAWITTPGLYKNDMSNHKYREFTTELSKYVVNTAVEHLIILGTCAEYGRQNGPSTAGITETSPNSLYAEQKVLAFHASMEQLKESKIRLTWGRIFYPYGPFQNEKRLIPYLIQSLRSGNPIRLADVSSIHDWITTRDIASAISWTIEHKMPVEIDIGTSAGFTNLELLTVIEELLNVHNRLNGISQHEIGLNEFFVVGKKSPLFISGWSPSDSLRSGLEWVLSK